MFLCGKIITPKKSDFSFHKTNHMNIRLLTIGKTDNKALQTLIDDYTKRLSFYVKFDLEIIPDIKNVKNLSEAQQKEKEAEEIN